MLIQELIELIDKIQKFNTEFSNIEVKEAHVDCSKKIYDTLSSFSNQPGGGVIVFGLSEEDDFKAGDCKIFGAGNQLLCDAESYFAADKSRQA